MPWIANQTSSTVDFIRYGKWSSTKVIVDVGNLIGLDRTSTTQPHLFPT